jgi:hypothetical protein
MNPSVLAAIPGVLSILLGSAALAIPQVVLNTLGFVVANQTTPAGAIGEIRGTFGGLFVVLGIATLQAAFRPFVHKSRLWFVAFLWLGVAAGRALSISLDGDPGLFGWGSLAFEAIMALLLFLAAAMAVPEVDPATTPVPVDPATI